MKDWLHSHAGKTGEIASGGNSRLVLGVVAWNHKLVIGHFVGSDPAVEIEQARVRVAMFLVQLLWWVFGCSETFPKSTS